MSDLRNQVIKLAYERPRLRKHLLPLITGADESFEEAIKGKKFKHPETGNDVVFKSLPEDEQKKVREEFNKKNNKGKEKGQTKKQKQFKDMAKQKPDHKMTVLEEQRESLSKDLGGTAILKIFEDVEGAPSAAKGGLKKTLRKGDPVTMKQISDVYDTVVDVLETKTFKKDKGAYSPGNKKKLESLKSTLEKVVSQT